jgi:hypothetical protein
MRRLFVLLLLCGCATPPHEIKQDLLRVNLLTARQVVKGQGVQGVTDSFTFEGQIIAFAAFTWPPEVNLGSQFITAKWFNGDRLISQRSHKAQFQKSPHYVYFPTTGPALGTGPCRVEIYVDDRLLATKAFTVSERRTIPDNPPTRGSRDQQT